MGAKAPHASAPETISTPARRARSMRARPSATWRSAAMVAAKRCASPGCLKNCPPGRARSSISTTPSPASAATAAADRPPAPPPITSRSGVRTARSDARIGASPVARSGRRTGKPCRRTVCGPVTLVMQARWLSRPSTLTRHSLQTPMPQNNPRRSPRAVSRSCVTPAAHSAAASVSPIRAATGRPSTSRVTSTAGLYESSICEQLWACWIDIGRSTGS